ncbi:roadblock/LC7 domain-containing protein [Streptomyces sp. G-5]|uniref:roadblock/LC7 domain-containing protein n=1 Tax=Streptomyces sp. G-5 TaxID=2977231 RepID=UPI0021CE5D73|nr:roadblock/LC7 domain-containing protein [Streptomyces sp. G-5]MCU4750250.1 roadblock/LC7 domain-containing protein [Streptomyces sp. G-5]
MTTDLGWILDEEIMPQPGAVHALLLSGDGLLIAASKGAEKDLADPVAAAVSGLQALSREMAGFAGCVGAAATWEQTFLEFVGGAVMIMAAGQGTYLAVSMTADADYETVGYAARKTVDRLSQAMGVDARTPGGAA